MTTAEEHRHIAEEFFRMAREAKTEEERKRFFDMALSWSQAAAGEEGQMDSLGFARMRSKKYSSKFKGLINYYVHSLPAKSNQSRLNNELLNNQRL
jgi:hypothetical protein